MHGAPVSKFVVVNKTKYTSQYIIYLHLLNLISNINKINTFNIIFYLINCTFIILSVCDVCCARVRPTD
ncbi:hypothetical protein QKQ66_gp014 [Dione juno nucleopolyhedrovirus]|uniref:Uncharacterized protein n=1 Tax=Dione juno nucleopolyhedrovirus TaxID=2594175 RepID=A0AAE6LC73_9ABAC|nr:hypothetical protein QKQ66_gp014 [Dione juno nucleopolyhedrovirus]QDL57010.1 hypothetical protein DijuNPV-ORF-14 [Dione juno nucleopolyhedrovirus]